MRDNDPQGRTFYTTGFLRVDDLKDGDIARIDGKWMWVYALVRAEDDPPKALADYGDFETELAEWEAASQNTVILHLVDDRASNADEVVHRFRVLIEYDLIEIQVPVSHPAVA